jgi:AcrR family transcriptional regulator
VGKSEQTRGLLIAVAERLFAERGIEAVSLREIAAAAGQRNNSAAAYHFGSRQGLIDAIFVARMAPIDRLRQAMLDDLEATCRRSDLDALCEALVLPLVSALDEEAGYGHYARFLAQVLSAPEFTLLNARIAGVTGGLRRVTDWLDAALVHLPPAVRAERITLAAGFVVHSLADRERAAYDSGTSRARGATSPSLFAANLVDATVGLLQAPMRAAARHTPLATQRA